MEKLTVTDARHLLENVITEKTYLEDLANTSDENLLKADLRYEFAFDSLDFPELICELERVHRIKLTDAQDAPFYSEPTVENFIKMVEIFGEDIDA